MKPGGTRVPEYVDAQSPDLLETVARETSQRSDIRDKC
jgi:hypothetical protein